MFKPLLRTLPTLSGNFTIECKLNEIIKNSVDEYSTYIRVANITPLQNSLVNKNIELNLLNGKYEYDILKYYHYYSNYFYETNFSYHKDNYNLVDLNSVNNETNDSRNKDYEFGCKRIKYNQTKYQFNFYAPFYLDDINDLPDYFCIHIILNDHQEKKIKIYLNKDNKRNYLKNYLTKYFKQIDDRVIFCLPNSLQATYFGIDVKRGGIVQYKDNVIGNLFINQTTINNFDYTICKGFERNNLIMRQVFPLSFSFNLNDIFNDYEKDFFAGNKIKIYGFYYTKTGMKYDLYDFDINYTHMYEKYNKYNKETGNYDFSVGTESTNNNQEETQRMINIMNVGFPALNESKYIKYVYTNKITPTYCKFKMLYSSDDDPYITNINFAYSYNHYPNQKYGYFPTMFKGIYPQCVVYGDDLKLPIGENLNEYYITKNLETTSGNTSNIDKYVKLMSNFYSSWYNVNQYSPDFLNESFIRSLFNNDNNWSYIKYNYTYFKGILYNLNFLEKYNIDNFGVFLGVNMNSINDNDSLNNIINAKYIFSTTEYSNYKIPNYNSNYNMESYIDDNNLTYYNKIFNLSKTSLSIHNEKYMFYDKTVYKNIYGKYIEEINFDEENKYYKLSDIKNKININNELILKYINILEYNSIKGYLLLDGLNNINYFEEITDDNNVEKKFIFSNELDNNNIRELYNKLYYETVTDSSKISLIGKDNTYNYTNLNYDENISVKFCMFMMLELIHKTDVINIINEYNKYAKNENKTLINISGLFNGLTSYSYNQIGNVNGFNIHEYFTVNDESSNNYADIYVDTYNLKHYIELYNNEHPTDKIVISYNGEEYYTKFINKKHIFEYINHLNRNEKYSDISIYDINLKNKCLFNYLYVKERCWIIDKNNELKIQDRYITLYNYLIKYLAPYNYIDDFRNVFTNYNDNDLLELFINNISDDRTENNKFIFRIKNFLNINEDINIELDLCFRKKMIKLNKSLFKLLKNNNYLYLYIKDKCNNENVSPWYTINNVNTYSDYDFKNYNQYLIPLFTNPYINELDITNINAMINTNKIIEVDGKIKYVLNNKKYFKEIDIDDEVLLIFTTDKYYNKWLDDIKNIYGDSVNEYNNFKVTWDKYCNDNNITFDNENIYIQNKIISKSEEIKYYCKLIISFIKKYDETLYRLLVQYLGIELYSINDSLDVNFNTINTDNIQNLEYIDEYNIYIYTYNNVKYAFYWLTLNIDNTSNSFNIINNFNLNSKFNSINGVSISNNIYLNKIFYLIEPFLKINIFTEFTKNVNSIVYPYEAEININYAQTLLNTNEHNKYVILKDSSDDILYNAIVKIFDTKKIKLLRYFNYITPYIKKTNNINDSWELRFMKDNEYKNTKKYNIFNRKDISIYKYNSIDIYDGVYNNETYQYNNVECVDQYEHKHFEDNILYNLPEYLYLTDKKQYTISEIEQITENKDKIKQKKIEILLKYFNKKKLDYNNIILFLFNKYDSNIIIDKIKTKNMLSQDLYKISYKFNLL